MLIQPPVQLYSFLIPKTYQAHSYARVAESCEKSAKFDDACKYHQKTVEFLKKSAEVATFDSTQESIRLQIQFHERQQEVVA